MGGLVRHHARARALAGARVSDAHDRDLAHERVAVEQVLDLTRAQLLTRADDDVLDAALDREVALVVQLAEVAGPEPAVRGEGVALERRIAVAHEELRPAGLDLAIADADLVG